MQLEPPEEVPANLEFAANAPPNFEKVLPKDGQIVKLVSRTTEEPIPSPGLRRVAVVLHVHPWQSEAKDVTALEAKVAYAYVSSPTLAKQINRRLLGK